MRRSCQRCGSDQRTTGDRPSVSASTVIMNVGVAMWRFGSAARGCGRRCGFDLPLVLTVATEIHDGTAEGPEEHGLRGAATRTTQFDSTVVTRRRHRSDCRATGTRTAVLFCTHTQITTAILIPVVRSVPLSSRTSCGPPEGGHYGQMRTGPATDSRDRGASEPFAICPEVQFALRAAHRGHRVEQKAWLRFSRA
jgi:hypothetical protein